MDNYQQPAGSGYTRSPNVHTTVTHDGPSTTTTTTTSNTLRIPGSPVTRQPSNGRRSPAPPRSRPMMQNRPSTIHIRRMPSSLAIPQEEPVSFNYQRASPTGDGVNRRRSASEPQRMSFPPAIHRSGDYSNTQAQYMSPVQEETAHTIPERPEPQQHPNQLAPATANTGRLRSASNATRRSLKRVSSRLSTTPYQAIYRGDDYETEVTDLLDVVDPEVSTLTTLNNVQNSLFVPDLGWLVNRNPTYNLSRRSTITATQPIESVDTNKPLPSRPGPIAEAEAEVEGVGEPYTADRRRRRAGSITSVLSETHYAVLPHGVRLEGWTEEEKEELNDHVRHLLHSRKEKFKRGMKGFGQYIRKPLGFFVTLYAVLITLFGLAWVLFLIGWINVGGRKTYDTNVIDNVLVALFAIMGDGLAPFRAVDTYHMIWIAHYHFLTWRLRREKAMPKLGDHNDLPLRSQKEADLEGKADDAAEFSVLNPLQQQRLTHHQNKFAKSHTFYKPHETTTHHAFPLRLLVAVVCLLDCHSLFQIALGTCTWAISYHVRPQALTATILCCSISCNITAGVLITVGDKKTRKKNVIEQMFRQKLTQQAIERVEQHRGHQDGEHQGSQDGGLEPGQSNAEHMKK